ncbi:hypothetical protein LXL04_023617 [Taraxacum kok-saghyz]
MNSKEHRNHEVDGGGGCLRTPVPVVSSSSTPRTAPTSTLTDSTRAFGLACPSSPAISRREKKQQYRKEWRWKKNEMKRWWRWLSSDSDQSSLTRRRRCGARAHSSHELWVAVLCSSSVSLQVDEMEKKESESSMNYQLVFLKNKWEMELHVVDQVCTHGEQEGDK